ncbi:MAG TPA: hypothetical protein VMY35_08025 [Phycisphaerae bacterium]|nr:hypothetical protein [Phycisphaerae bacterium]
MGLNKRIRCLAAKFETSPGEVIALALADAAFNVFDADIQQTVEMELRPKQSGFTQLPAVPGARQGRAKFSTHFYGASATPAGMATFLPAVGMGVNTGAYVLDPLPLGAAATTQESLTIGSYQNGRIKKIFGAQGNMKCTLPAGKLALAEFDFLGKWSAPIDGAILAAVHPALAPLRVVSATLAVGAWTTAIVANVTIDLQNKLYLRESVNDATGFDHCIITDRLVKVTLDPESELVATKDIYAEWLASTEADLAIVLAAGAATCTITASDLQWMNPQEGEREGMEIDQIECQCNLDDLKFLFA